MKICIAGASGFIGSNLLNYLNKEEHEVTVISRDDFRSNKLGIKIQDCECIINLTGESIAGIWTGRKKSRIYNSRVKSTRLLVEQVNKTAKGIKVFINVSGVAIYDRKHKHSEDSLLFARNFLSGVIIDWEGALQDIKDQTIRKVILRLGVVLGRNGGIMKRVIVPLRFGVGFSIKSSDNLPFVHLRDLLEVFKMVINDDCLHGIINVVSPENTNIGDFFRLMGDEMKCKLRVNLKPEVIKAIMGESSTILVEGQSVNPDVLVKRKFLFQFPGISEALKNILTDH